MNFANEDQPDCVCVGGIVIDDIVFPDGQTRMEVLGGGVAHAAAGMAIWGQRPGICASIGHGLPEAVYQRLAHRVDMRGVLHLDLPQARAWQVFEWDGQRTEIPRVANWDPFFERPAPHEVPAAYQQAKGFHILRSAACLPSWRRLFPKATLLWEPEQRFMIAENADIFRHALHYVDIVSPNLVEAQLMYGIDEPVALVRAMIRDSANIAALRMGSAGSLVGMQGKPDLIALPAVTISTLVDQTGAGNTYCGAFLVGWLETGELAQAAIYGGVAASFALETLGVAETPPPELRDTRYNWLSNHIQLEGGSP